MFKNYSHIYLLGIGGIGMSALARYFYQMGYMVAGYDKTSSLLTQSLAAEGISIHYKDLGASISTLIGVPDATLVIYTPAVPKTLNEYLFLQSEGYTIKKRAEVLGIISKQYKTLAVAGTHGKTTTSTLLSYVLQSSPIGCNAFLGGVSANFNSNLLIDKTSEWMVVEADEFDRSFHQLSPYSSIITSVEADHLDIYQDGNNLKEAFIEFAQLNSKEGQLIISESVTIFKDTPHISYGFQTHGNYDYHAKNIRIENQQFIVDIQTPTNTHRAVVLGLPGIHNVLNALAVIAICESIGIKWNVLQTALATFKGVKRRFEKIYQSENITYIDDYAHHPTAINNLLQSIKLMYPNQSITAIFQPHLYSRTKDFMDEFALALQLADHVILMPIYPARETPIKGITSEALAQKTNTSIKVLDATKILTIIKTIQKGILLTIGAGNIDKLVEPINQILHEKNA